MDSVPMCAVVGWHCPVCRSTNLVVLEPELLSDEGCEEAYRQHHELEEWAELPEGWRDSFDVSVLPERVTCRKCRGQFVTRHEGTENP